MPLHTSLRYKSTTNVNYIRKGIAAKVEKYPKIQNMKNLVIKHSHYNILIVCSTLAAICFRNYKYLHLE